MVKRITVVGGAGDMARVAARTFLSLIADCRLVVAGFDLEKARKAAASFAPPRSRRPSRTWPGGQGWPSA